MCISFMKFYLMLDAMLRLVALSSMDIDETISKWNSQPRNCNQIAVKQNSVPILYRCNVCRTKLGGLTIGSMKHKRIIA